MHNIIAISGKSGCGNTTISGIIAKKLNYKLINYTFRQLAEKYRLDFKEILELSKHDKKYDIELDNHQIELAMQGNCVLGSRLAIWLLKNKALTIYINAGIDKRIKNIQNRESLGYIELYKFHHERDEEDHQRFLDLYGIDNNEYEFADIIIDADNKNVEEIVNEILNKIKEKKLYPTTASS